MKNRLTLLFLFFCAVAFSQTPKLINYQGIARGNDGGPVGNQGIKMRFEILQGSATGSVVYTEDQSITTNSLGLISTQIGKGGNLGTVNWQNGPFYLQISVDFLGGSNLVALGSPQQMLSVPFSMHAATVPGAYTPSTNVLDLGGNTFTLNSTPNTTINSQGIVTVTSTATNSFMIAVPEPTFTSSGPIVVSGTYPNFTVTAPIPPTPTVSGTGAVTITNPVTNSFVVGVPQTSVTITSNPGTASVTSAGTNSFNINIPAGVTPTVNGGGALTVAPATIGNNFTLTVPQSTITQTGAAVVTSAGTNTFNVHVPTSTITQSGAAVVTTAGTNTFNVHVPTSTITQGGVAQVTSPGTNSFNISVPGTSVIMTQTAGTATISSSGTNTFNINVPQTALTQSGAVQVTPGTTNSFTIHVPTTTITQGGAALVTSPGTNSFNVTVPQTSIAITQTAGTATVSSSGTNTFNINVPFPVITPFGVLTSTPSGNSFSLSVPGTSITQSGAASVTPVGTNSFNVHVPTTTVTEGGVAVVTTAGTNSFNVSVPGTSITQSGAASVTPVGTNSFIVHVPTGTLTSTGMATVTSAGTNSFNVFVPTTTVTQSGAVQVSSSTTNSFNIHVPTSTVTQSGVAVVTSAGTNSFNVAVPGTSITQSGAASVTAVGTNSFNVHVPTSTVTSTGIATVTSAGTNSFNVNVPAPAYTNTTGVLTLGSSTTLVAPTITLSSSGVLQSGPSSNTVNISGISPWVQSASTVALVNPASFVGIGTSTPQAQLNIDVQGNSNSAILINNSRDVSGGAMPLHVILNTAGQTYGTNTFGRAMRLTHSVTATAFDFGFHANGDFFLARLNTYSPPHMVFTTGGRTGFGVVAPTENLQVESTTNSSVSIVSGAAGTSDLFFGSSATHGLGRIRYNNSNNTISLWTGSTSRFSIDGNGVGLFGPTTTTFANTAMTISRAGAFNNQVIITGGDNSNSFGGVLSLGENINPGFGMALRLEAISNKLYITNDLAGNSPVVGIGGYSGQPNGMAIGTGFAGAASPADGLIVQGNTGIGSSNPGTKLEVIGDISIPNGNKITFGTISSGSGIGEWIQNSGSGLEFRTASVPRVNIANNGFVGIGTTAPSAQLQVVGSSLFSGNVGIGTTAPATNLHVVGDQQVTGSIRMGNEATATAPSYPFGSSGMVIRRILNTVANSAGVVMAVTDQLSFQRDGVGSNGGFRIVNTGGSGNETCQCFGVTSAGLNLNKSIILGLGTTQVYLDTDNIVFMHCIFGDPFNAGHTTEISMTRFPGDWFWMGTITSTFNQ